MSKTVNIGGDRLGSGNKMNTSLHGYQRSTHDLGHIFKSTMSCGTLVPFMVKVALPGDTFDITLDANVKTHPTLGPLFGSFKLQLDVFTVPFRLYNRTLHNNKLNVGMKIGDIKLPMMEVSGPKLSLTDSATYGVPYEFQQINQSSILAYLGLRGLGNPTSGNGVKTQKLAVPLIGYWDIFKNYYANKQEEKAYVIHGSRPSITVLQVNGANLPYTPTNVNATVYVEGVNVTADNVQIQRTNGSGAWYKLSDIFEPGFVTSVIPGQIFFATKIKSDWINVAWNARRIVPAPNMSDMKPELREFDLEKIDTLRARLLAHDDSTPYILTQVYDLEPYNLVNQRLVGGDGTWQMAALCNQEGLAVKTYQSDIFNNWVQTDWIEGPGSIAAVTAISTAGGSFTLDTLNLSKKVYDMLNRIAVSGGSLEDWVSAVYDHNSKWRAEGPVYQGGLSKEIVFQQVVSMAATESEPLGSLAGQGVLSGKHKGGKVVINVDEPLLIMGIVSITPRVDYSQGNEWFTYAIKTLNDLHKPALDGIGFQDLITDQMAFWDTRYDPAVPDNMAPTFSSAGKQPAWLNYMTDYNKAYGNFADPRTQMFMTLNRRYTIDDQGSFKIKDLTTYIDPSKFNYAFAQTDLGAQNFWVQIAANIDARRKMSAKVIPNL